jgi:uncharacterized membrane protein YkvI
MVYYFQKCYWEVVKMQTEKKMSWKTIFILAGAYISYCVGASFGTGQEHMQYFGSLGISGLLGLTIATLLTITLVVLLIRDCRDYHLSDMKIMFTHYCGKYIGTFLRWYSVLYIFLIAGCMIAGAASVFNEHYGLNYQVGALIMLAIVLLTTVLGMQKIINIIGNIAPVIVLFVLIISIYNLINNVDGIVKGSQMIQSNSSQLRISDNFVKSGVLYFSVVILFVGSYLASISTRPNTLSKEMLCGNVSGATTMFVLQFIMLCALLCNGSVVAGSAVPMLMLGKNMGRFFAVIYGAILILAIFTTTVPSAWIVASNLIPEKNKWYKLVAAVVCLAAYGLTLVASFAKLINVIMSVSSYIGILLIIGMIVTMLFRKPAKPN